MGSGKGALDHWVAVVRPGKILFEMEGVTPDIAAEAMRLASNKAFAAQDEVCDAAGCREGCRRGKVEGQLLAISFQLLAKSRFGKV